MSSYDPYRTYDTVMRGEARDLPRALASLARASSPGGGPLGAERSGEGALEDLLETLRLRLALENAMATYATGPDRIRTAYDMFVIFFFDQDLHLFARFRRDELRAAEKERAGSRTTSENPWIRLELGAILCLQGRVEEAGDVLEAWQSEPPKGPYDGHVRRIRRFLRLLPDENWDDAWERADVERHPWEELGFLPWQAEGWARTTATPGQASTLRRIGLSPERARPWLEAQIPVSEVTGWRAAGLSATAAVAWQKADFNQRDALMWHSSRADPAQARAWADNDFSTRSYERLGHNAVYRLTAEQARSFRHLGLDDDGILEWIYAGVIDPEVARKKLEAGSGPEDVEAAPADLENWQRRGFSRADRTAWLRIGLSPDEALDFRTHGFDPRTALPWVEARITARLGARWRNVDVDITQAIRLEQEGVEPRHAELFSDAAVREQWRTAGFRLGDATPWLQQGLLPAEAWEWASIEAPVIDAKVMRKAGIHAHTAREWRASGLSAWHEVQRWAETPVPPEDATSWLALGITPHVATQCVEAGMEAKDVRRLLDAGIAPNDLASRHTESQQ